MPTPQRARGDELLAVLAPMKGEMVEVDSNKTGTPLPQSYQPARALAKSGS